MAMKNDPLSPPVGMRDFLPQKKALRNHVRDTLIRQYEQFGFGEIETSSVNRIGLLNNGEGGDNEKLIFKILRRGEKLNLETAKTGSDLVDLGLRYDQTVPLARFYAKNKHLMTPVAKVIQIGKVWRAERPQKGRYREFVQSDIDILGDGSSFAEVELITATIKALSAFELPRFKVLINDRRILSGLMDKTGFAEAEMPQVLIVLDKMDKIGLQGVKSELEKEGYAATAVQSIANIIGSLTGDNALKTLKEKLDNVDSAVFEEMEGIISTVRQLGEGDFDIRYELALVRGMGYYTGPIFEVQTEGYPWSVAGGGRYDKLLGKLLQSKEDIPACGFSIGFERLVMMLEDRNFEVPRSGEKVLVLFDKREAGMHAEIMHMCTRLHAKGYHTFVDKKRKNLKNQLKTYGENGFRKYTFFRPENNDAAVMDIPAI